MTLIYHRRALVDFLRLGNKGVQTVSMEIAKEGFRPVYESEVQRLARMLSGIEADVESFKGLLPRTSKIPKKEGETWIS